MIKRAFDIVFSTCLLVVTLPLWPVIALAIIVESGTPVIFSQRRVGLHFGEFVLFKFRSMRNLASGPCITAAGDARVTKVGTFLRLTKLDELPQLWNVLKGDMSIVGPRPEVIKYVELYRPNYERLLQVRPGITDPASILFRNEEHALAVAADPEKSYTQCILPAKLAVSAQYLCKASLPYDLCVIARTAAALLLRCRGF